MKQPMWFAKRSMFVNCYNVTNIFSLYNSVPHRPKMPSTYVVNVCSDISQPIKEPRTVRQKGGCLNHLNLDAGVDQ